MATPMATTSPAGATRSHGGPVVPGLDGPAVRPDRTLDFTQPCHPQMITMILKRMYPLAGVTQHLTGMSLRREFAHELSRVPNLASSTPEEDLTCGNCNARAESQDSVVEGN